MLKLCPCIYGVDAEEKEQLREAKEQRKRSKEIDKKLKKEGEVFKQTIKLLLLGAGESGKSTILKQMRIIHISKFTEQERRQKINDIKSNIRDSILSILDAMERFNIPFEDPAMNGIREYVYENIDLIFSNSKTQDSPPQSNLLSRPSVSTASLHDVISGFVGSSNALNNTSSSAHLTKSQSSVLQNQKYFTFINIKDIFKFYFFKIFYR